MGREIELPLYFNRKRAQIPLFWDTQKPFETVTRDHHYAGDKVKCAYTPFPYKVVLCRISDTAGPLASIFLVTLI